MWQAQYQGSMTLPAVEHGQDNVEQEFERGENGKMGKWEKQDGCSQDNLVSNEMIEQTVWMKILVNAEQKEMKLSSLVISN